MVESVTTDHEIVAAALDSAKNSLPEGPSSSTGSNVDPSVSGKLDDGNKDTKDTLGDAGDDADKTKDASEGLDDADQEGGSKTRNIGTELSGDHSGGGGPSSALSSPSGGAPSGGGGAPSGGGAPPSMPPMSMPSSGGGGGAPSGGSGNPTSGNAMKVPTSKIQDLLKNYDPKDGKSDDKDSDFGGADGKGGDPRDKLSNSDVDMKKTGLGPLTNSQMNAVMNKAMDLNGISKDESVRAKFRECWAFMAAHESSRNPDAINLTDSNARGAPAKDGHPFQCSRGIWQTIPQTFAAYHVGGTSKNIYDPTASCASSINYVMHRYNVGHDGSGLQAFYGARQRGGYTGY